MVEQAQEDASDSQKESPTENIWAPLPSWHSPGCGPNQVMTPWRLSSVAQTYRFEYYPALPVLTTHIPLQLVQQVRRHAQQSACRQAAPGAFVGQAAPDVISFCPRVFSRCRWPRTRGSWRLYNRKTESSGGTRVRTDPNIQMMAGLADGIPVYLDAPQTKYTQQSDH